MRNSLLLVGTLTLALPIFAQERVESIHVDLSDARKNVIHASLQIPVTGGDMTLVYPKWIPGNHAPTGPIGNLAGLVMSANGRRLDWARDPLDMYAFHVKIPANVTTLDVKLDFLAMATPEFGPAASTATTEKQAVLRWAVVVLYPEHAKASDWMMKPEITLPEGWKYATALDGANQAERNVTFAAVSLDKLIDSPVIAGEYFRRIPIAPEIKPLHFVDIVADAPDDLVTTPQQDQAFNNLVVQAGALFHWYHFEHYDFLISLSDKFRAHTGIGGLEHHESSDDPGSANVFRSPAGRISVGMGLAHEYTHSWNGKYRRPAGEYVPNFQTPLDTRLLWVYEGLTNYLGYVLSARSGATTAEDFRDSIADQAAQMDHVSGRVWRNLQDDSFGMQTMLNAGHGWANWRRGIDYYPEGTLVWLGVDVKIRTLTKNAKSLDDFCRLFFGRGGDTGPETVPYTFEQLTAALNSVVPYDWKGYLNQRLQSHAPNAPLDGLTEGGWNLGYAETPTEQMAVAAHDTGSLNAMYSIGLELSGNGMITDVGWGSAADAAGLAPGMRVLDAGGKAFTVDAMRQAMKTAQATHTDLLLTVSNTGYKHAVHIPCPQGEQYPHLTRKEDVPDLLDDIAKPIAITQR
ncbi:MAG: M61 family peptidase [Candidatus Acidiferrales bacterium]